MPINTGLKRYSYLITNDIKNEIWNLLRIYQSASNITKSYKSRNFKDKITRKKSEDIAALVIHAEEYFKSSVNSSLSIKPLLIFYGIYSLSKALILFKNTEKTNILDVHGHGLSDDTNKYIKIKSSIDKTTATLKSKRGVFIEFNDCMASQQLIIEDRGIQLIKNYPYEKTDKIKNLSISLKDVFSRIPELITIYMRTYNKKPNCIRGDYKIVNDMPEYHIKNLGSLAYSDKRLKTLFSPAFNKANFNKINTRETIITPTRSFYLPYETSLFSGNKYFIAPVKEKLISLPSLLYLGTYIMGMIVRYDPTRWNKVTIGKKGGIYPIITKFIEYLEIKFPLIALNELSFHEHKFGTSQVFFEEVPDIL